ncbi:hypothetical protein [Lactococcus petauri]|nr:hypothetical protein [Lactococcus petauri]
MTLFVKKIYKYTKKTLIECRMLTPVLNPPRSQVGVLASDQLLLLYSES